MAEMPTGFLVQRRDDGFGDVYPLIFGQSYTLGRAPECRIAPRKPSPPSPSEAVQRSTPRMFGSRRCISTSLPAAAAKILGIEWATLDRKIIAYDLKK